MCYWNFNRLRCVEYDKESLNDGHKLTNFQ